MSARVAFTYKAPASTRDGAWLTGFFTDLRTATGALGDRNLREEGVRLRHFDVTVPGGAVATMALDPVVALSPGPTLVAQQAWGALPGAVVANIAGPFTIAPNEMVRVRASLQMPYTVIGPVPGCPSGSRAEMRIAWTRGGVPEPDLFSEVWIEHGLGFPAYNAAPVLTTYATYLNNTGANQTFTNIRIEFQNNGGATPADSMVDNVRLEAEKFRVI